VIPHALWRAPRTRYLGAGGTLAELRDILGHASATSPKRSHSALSGPPPAASSSASASRATAVSSASSNASSILPCL
jgi:hypothetical protein